MRPETISDAVGLLSETAITQNPPKTARRWYHWAAVAACFCLVLAVILGRYSAGSVPAAAETLAEAVYPAQAPYPIEWDEEKWNAWWEQQEQRLDQPAGYTNGVTEFFGATAPLLLNKTGQNQVYSPLNVYVALGMLSEVTAGSSQAQILRALGASDQQALRRQITSLWTANYRNDGSVNSLLANSLWLDESVTYKQASLDTLAESYYASAYRGEMGSDTLNNTLREWVDQQTGGLLHEQAEQLELDDRTLLALVSTLYFRAQWNNEFDPADTAPGVFHGLNGDITCDFMCQTAPFGYGEGRNFSVVEMSLGNEGGGVMRLVLPNEGVTPAQLVEEGVLTDVAGVADDVYDVELSLPKFDVSADIDLKDTLSALGITDVFNSELADFSAVTDEQAFLSEVQHAARLAVDEEGCMAAAFTMMDTGMGGPDKTVAMHFDRPFLFVLCGADDVPLMAGTVYQP